MHLRITLRLKLVLASLFLLLLPIIGVQISEQIKRDLLLSQEDTLIFSARAVAAVLAGQPELFIKEKFHPKDTVEMVYMPPIHHPIRLNAKSDDWPTPQKHTILDEDYLLFDRDSSYDFQLFHVKQLLGERGDYIYAFFEVTDPHIIYRRKNSLRLDRSDHIEVRIEDNNGKMRVYYISPYQPGWINGYLYEGRNTAILEPRIQGVWEEGLNGYTVEMRLPREMVGNRLAFLFANIDDEQKRSVNYIIGTNKKRGKESLGKDKDGNIVKKVKKTKMVRIDGEVGWIINPSQTIEAILKTFERPNFRVSIVDANRRVRATYGELNGTPPQVNEPVNFQEKMRQKVGRYLSPVYRIFTTSFSNSNIARPEALSTLNLDGVQQALNGEPVVTRYTPVATEKYTNTDSAPPDDRLEVMAAIVPLKNGSTTVGAVLVEQTTNTILALQNKVIEESITMAAIAFSVGGLAIILFAFRISSRIRRVGRDAANAITSSGQIQTITPMNSSDEIGDLSRTLAAMLLELKNQSDFRERMADNLEHEMRTPLAGISASLKNLAGEVNSLSPETQRYAGWALHDVQRLESLMTDIRDATNLHEMLHNDHRENFELDIAIEMWCNHSWQPAFNGTGNNVEFIYHRPQNNVMFYGDPQRIHQLLDKLIENAVSFHRSGSPIEITLNLNNSTIILKVANFGSTIPREMQGQIFNSMITNREKGSGKDDKPHLGLGLYIVRTIVEAYQGEIKVNSSEKLQQTVFTIKLPINS